MKDALPERTDTRPDAPSRRQATELTLPERQARRRNRKVMSWVAIPGILLGSAALAASLAADRGPAAPRPLSIPAGYKAVNDGVFAYSVPLSWSKNLAYSDDTGDLDYSGTSGWAGEFLGARGSPPPAGAHPPGSFADFGETRSTPYSIGSALRVTVAGVTVAYRYEVTRPDGFEAVAVNAWQASSGAEIWLLVHAPPPVASTILATLRGS